jgi:geranylgeranyl pyrophosphate synthase
MDLKSAAHIFDPLKLDLKLVGPTAIPAVTGWTHDLLLTGGKQLRPKLCLMMAKAIGVPQDEIVPFAQIAEWVHSATLAHDDVIDSATERRNRPTLNARLTQARAVLSGDLLLSRSMVQLSDLGVPEALRAMAVVLEDLVTGEWLQLEMRGSLNVTSRMLENIAKLKTASLIEWCCQVPFFYQGAPESKTRMAKIFGYHLGMAFQKIDDSLDYEHTSGKDYLKDLKEGLLNSVSVFLLENAPNPGAFSSPESVAERFDELFSVESVQWAQAQVRQSAEVHVEMARQALEQLKVFGQDEKSFEPLFEMVRTLNLRSK